MKDEGMNRSRLLRVILPRSAFILGCALAVSGAQAQQWKPSRPVELIVGSGAGSSTDRQARVVQKYLQNVPGISSIVINNRAGGGGTLAYTYLAQHPGDAHYIVAMATS